MKMFFRSCFIVLARFALSATFLASAVSHLFQWQETEMALVAVLGEWQSYISFSEILSYVFALAVPWASILLLVATLLQLIGALLLLLGVREKWGASLLLLILMPSTILFHQFWFMDVQARELQSFLFLKNLAIMGGLLMVILYGAQGNFKDSGSSSNF